MLHRTLGNLVARRDMSLSMSVFAGGVDLPNEVGGGRLTFCSASSSQLEAQNASVPLLLTARGNTDVHPHAVTGFTFATPM